MHSRPCIRSVIAGLWNRVITEKIPAEEVMKKFLTFLETRKSINVFF